MISRLIFLVQYRMLPTELQCKEWNVARNLEQRCLFIKFVLDDFKYILLDLFPY